MRLRILSIKSIVWLFYVKEITIYKFRYSHLHSHGKALRSTGIPHTVPSIFIYCSRLSCNGLHVSFPDSIIKVESKWVFRISAHSPKVLNIFVSCMHDACVSEYKMLLLFWRVIVRCDYYLSAVRMVAIRYKPHECGMRHLIDAI